MFLVMFEKRAADGFCNSNLTIIIIIDTILFEVVSGDEMEEEWIGMKWNEMEVFSSGFLTTMFIVIIRRLMRKHKT